MSVPLALLLFGGSLLLSMMSSAVLAERLDQVGRRFAFPAGLLGLVTALCADSPEIASALTALIGGQHELGRGVIFGSNIFNIAALFGISTLVVGRIPIARPILALNGGVALWLALVVGAQALGWLGALGAGLLLVMVVVPFLVVSSIRRATLDALPLSDRARRWLARLVYEKESSQQEKDSSQEEAGAIRQPTRADGLSIVPLLAMIVISSIALVRSAEFLGHHWGLSQLVIGTFGIATLTGLPNLTVALHLARRARGAALSSEAFNSNSLNLLFGAYLPTLFVQLQYPSSEGILSLAVLVAMTAVAIALGVARRGLGRPAGLAFVGCYVAYALISLW